MSKNVFSLYSAYYDLLYLDKDYRAEAQFVHSLLARFAPQASSLLELGCGTGRHAALLAQAGYEVLGIDQSREMLTQARGHLSEADIASVSLEQGDARTYRAGRSFDAVVSLFHVLSYQTSDDDVLAMLRTAAAHLDPGGIFVADFWFAPAVLGQKPSVRVKRMESDRFAVTRIAEPKLDAAGSVCAVDYTIFVRDKDSGRIEQINEVHRMRFFNLGELRMAAENAGLRLLDSCEWMTGHAPSIESWGVCAIFGR